MNYKLLSVFLYSLFVSGITFSQRGHDGDYTVSTTTTVVNSYTSATANASAGATTITVASNAMNGGAFTGPLAAGDLILIIQMQGVTMDINTYPAAPPAQGGLGLPYTVPQSYYNIGWDVDQHTWGQVTNYNNCGKFEQVEVRGVSGTNTILLQCGLQNSYDISGKVQIVRIPRFQNLTVNTNTAIIPTAWNGTSGGIVAIEVNGNLTFNAGSRISASTYGFRGAIADNTGLGQDANQPSIAGNGTSYLGSPVDDYGGRKGEGVGGFTAEYDNAYSRYGRGAPANGGGGGGHQNAGGGGGSNIGSGTYTGKGIPNPAYNTAWNLDMAGMANSVSPGGGRGGYTYSASNQDANVTAPNASAWGGDLRKRNGGFGGHALQYDPTRIFMGGGGGAGDQDNGQGGAGGAGGGIVMLTVYGTVSGSGLIEADGAVGQKTNPNNQGTSGFPSSNNKRGNDGAGGGGAGGSIYIRNSNPLPATITLNARGGNGGNVDLLLGVGAAAESTGPGGAGAGGAIAFTSGTPIQNLNGGNAGTSNSPHVTEMIVNGSTNGHPGVGSLAAPTFDILVANDTICSGTSATLTATVTGTAPGTISWYSQQFGGSVIGTGTTFTTPSLTATTTYYVGVCPGTFRRAVTVVVQPSPVVSGTAVVTDAGCTAPGSITGLTPSGGTAPLNFSWNGVSSVGTDLNNASAGSYTLTVTDANGCQVQSGPYTISGTGGPTINSTNVVITDELCNGTLGSITGITATGNSITYSWSPSGGSAANASGLTQGTYTLTVTDNVGCVATAGPFNVGFVAGPTVDATGVNIVQENCDQANGSISGISATGNGLTYSWTNGGGNALDATSLSAGSYSLTVTDNNGCTATAGPFSVTETIAPSIDVTGLSIVNEVCSQGNGSIGGILVSGGIPALTIAWTNSSQTTVDLSNLSAGSYSLTVTDAVGCVSTAGPFDVLNVGGPVLDESNAVVSDVQCDGTLGSISGITASGTGLTYSWSNGGGNNVDATGLSAGSYVLTVTDGNGCTATSATYAVQTPVLVDISTVNMVVTPTACTSNTGSISGITFTGGDAGTTVSWSNGSSDIDQSGLGMGTYTLTVTNSLGCSDQVSVEIVMNNAPVIDATNVSVSSAHCGQSDASISGISVSGGTPAYTYEWNGNSSLNTIDLSNIPSGSYELTVTDAAGCSDTETINVSEVSGPQIDDNALEILQPTCTAGGSITGLQFTGEAPFDFVWSGDTLFTSDISNLVPGSYSLTVTDAFGCIEQYGPIVLNEPTGPVANFTWTPEFPDVDENVIFDNTSTGQGPLVYEWSIDGQVFDTENIDYSFSAEGSYPVILYVTDANGCVSVTSQTVLVYSELNIPNVITANSDGNNDTFVVEGLKPNTSLIILNRWGNVVWETSNYLNDWNGKDQDGTDLKDGVYTYLITPENDKPMYGFIHLVR